MLEGYSRRARDPRKGCSPPRAGPSTCMSTVRAAGEIVALPFTPHAWSAKGVTVSMQGESSELRLEGNLRHAGVTNGLVRAVAYRRNVSRAFRISMSTRDPRATLDKISHEPMVNFVFVAGSAGTDLHRSVLRWANSTVASIVTPSTDVAAGSSEKRLRDAEERISSACGNPFGSAARHFDGELAPFDRRLAATWNIGDCRRTVEQAERVMKSVVRVGVRISAP